MESRERFQSIGHRFANPPSKHSDRLAEAKDSGRNLPNGVLPDPLRHETSTTLLA
jgi:hypothetical protein